jgi:SAM-dependent methyltransferase
MREVVSQEVDRVFNECDGASLHDIIDALQEMELTPTQEELQEISEWLSRRGWIGHGDCVAPGNVRSFLTQVISGQQLRDVLDPWSGSGNLLVDIVSASPEVRLAVGITPSKERWVSAKAFWEILDVSELRNRIEWKHGSPIEHLINSEEQFDLVASVLPFGAMASREDLASVQEFANAAVKDGLGNLILLVASSRLRPGGIGVFVVPPDFVRPRERQSVYASLQSVGLNLDAYIALPDKTFEPFTSISTGIAIIRRGEQQKVFVGELQESEKRQALLMDNWRRHAAGLDVSLGVLVNKDEFTGFAPFRARAELEAALRRIGFPVCSTNQLILEVNALKEGSFEERGNAVYVPNVGTSRVVLAQEECKNRPHDYFQWVLDPEVVDARYFAGFMNTEVGVLFRRALFSGNVIPKMMLGTIKAGAPLAVPPIEIQRKIIQEETQIANLQSELSELRSELWRKPKSATAIADKIRRVNREETFVDWLDTLPFPLASILWYYHTTKRPKEKLELLSRFFEALAEFLSATLLSAVKVDEALWSEAQTMLSENREQLEKSSFGAWVSVAGVTAQSLRRIYNNERSTADATIRRNRVERILATSHSEFINALLSKKIIGVLQEANTYRNNYLGHAGMLTDRVAGNLLPTLEASLAEVRSCYGTRWNRYLLISPTMETQWTGERFKVTAHVLNGSRTPFPTEVFSLVAPLKTGVLYFVDPIEDRALELIPLIKIDSPPMSERTACYFYNRIQPDGVRYISYHYGPEIERKYTSDEARAILTDLLGR